MEKTTLYLPDDMHHALRELARRTGRPQADVMREAIGTYLRQQERPPLRSVGLGDNPDVHAEDTEAWLEAHWHPA